MALKKPPLVLLFLLSLICILRLLRITITSNPSSSFPPPSRGSPLKLSRSSLSPTYLKLPTHLPNDLSPKELHLLSNLIHLRAPCNLLVFGLGSESHLISKINSRGTTIFIEDSDEKIKQATLQLEHAQIHKISYPTQACKAYELLRMARGEPACAPPQPKASKASRCPLELTSLPKVVYEQKWDVLLVNGPGGDSLEAPGRMEVIYTAAVMARAGKMTDVLVHDVDRMIEKWYSWEFLCQENLVASKGKMWHFKITGTFTSTSFCSNATFCVK